MNSAEQPNRPLVSVVIPCYNREAFVADAIESVLKQTYQNFEVILVNDGSADRTEEVIQRYLSDPRVRYLKHEVNRGIPAARNTGIKNSKGEFIAFLDSDDMWLPDKIETQYRIFSQDTTGNLGVVWSNSCYRDELGATRMSKAHVPDDLASLSAQSLLRKLFFTNFVIAGTSMIRRFCFDTVGLLDEQLRGGSDDFDLWMRLAPYFTFRYVPTPLAVIRLHGGNYSSIERHFQDVLIIVEKAVLQNPELAVLKDTRLATLRYSLGLHCLDHGRSREAREHLWKAVKSNPFVIKPLVSLLFASCGALGRAGRKIYGRTRVTKPQHNVSGFF